MKWLERYYAVVSRFKAFHFLNCLSGRVILQLDQGASRIGFATTQYTNADNPDDGSSNSTSSSGSDRAAVKRVSTWWTCAIALWVWHEW